MQFINLLEEHNEGNFLTSDGGDKSHLRYESDAIKNIVDTLKRQKKPSTNKKKIKLHVYNIYIHFCSYIK